MQAVKNHSNQISKNKSEYAGSENHSNQISKNKNKQAVKPPPTLIQEKKTAEYSAACCRSTHVLGGECN